MIHFIKDFLSNEHFLNSEDAVAEVLDFVTIIGILVVSLSIIGLAGYPVLKSSQETRYIENTRQSFVVVAENLNKIGLGQAPSKSLELKMYGGSLSVTRDSWINITAENSTDTITLVDQQMGNIESTIGDTVVAYEGTGVWIKYPSGVILNPYKPLITNQSNVIVIPIIKISGNYSVAGTGINRLRANGVPDVSYYGNVNNLTIRITGDYVEGWRDYFENMIDLDFIIGSSDYTAKMNTTDNVDVYILNTYLYTEIE